MSEIHESSTKIARWKTAIDGDLCGSDKPSFFLKACTGSLPMRLFKFEDRYDASAVGPHIPRTRLRPVGRTVSSPNFREATVDPGQVNLLFALFARRGRYVRKSSWEAHYRKQLHFCNQIRGPYAHGRQKAWPSKHSFRNKNWQYLQGLAQSWQFFPIGFGFAHVPPIGNLCGIHPGCRKTVIWAFFGLFGKF